MLKEISHACGLAWGGWNTFERLKKVAMHIFMNNLFIKFFQTVF